eukprot:TRINITY_DN2776_c0_g1_i1.p1 TRINITY_DN2776_c0_g1~~TRINITY_DN2776_c0_g1_i1.p1  ORF type:complete len:565 (+),score=157.64 TRINITY_DN2776_c0_g1_i1:89-1783(+)
MAEPGAKRLKLNGDDADIDKLEDVKQSQEVPNLDEIVEDEAGGGRENTNTDDQVDGNELDQLLEAANDAPAQELESEDRGKKKKRRSGEEGEEELPEVADVETDTEYDQIDLSNFPAKLRVEASINEKMNGLYRLLPKPSRGRPSYCKTRHDSKPLFLYWAPSKKWQVGYVCGGKSSFGYCKDIGETYPPIEPYPNVWQVQPKADKGDEKKQDKVKCLGMRVIDQDVWEEAQWPQDLIQPDEVAPEKEAAEKSSSPTKEPAAKAKEKTKSPQKATGAAPAVATAAKSTNDDEAAMVEAAAGSSDESDDDDKKAKESDSNQTDESQSESESSSSEESASPTKPAAKATTLQELSKSAQALITKLHALPPNEAPKKAAQVMEGLRTKIAAGKSVGGMNTEDLKQVQEYCRRTFGIAPAQAAKPQAAKQARQNAAQPSTPDMPDAGQPTTPPMDAPIQRVPANALPHRTMKALPKVLRLPGSARNYNRRLNYVDNTQIRTEVSILSYKASGEHLWYQSPGALVFCDDCDRQVPQAMGQLQGAPSRSQFAQNEFLCTECMQRRYAQQI